MADKNSWTQRPRVRQALDYFQAQGWSPANAAGIVSNLYAESRLRENVPGDAGQAYGIGQWHPPRQQQFKDAFGKEIANSSFEDQLGFVHHELTAGKDPQALRAGARLRDAQTAGQSATIFMKGFERPSDPDGSKAFVRAQMAEDLHGAGTPNAGATP
jgi:hypothetical protein